MTICFDGRWRGPHGIGRFATELARRCHLKPLSIGGAPTDLWDAARLAWVLGRLKPVHFFTPGFNVPLGHPCPFSLTIHDLIHLDVKEESSRLKRGYYDWLVRPALERADVVFTVSEFSRKRIIEWSGIDPDRVAVIGNGVGAEFNPEGERWHHARPYLLYVGNQRPHKNVEGLLRAFVAAGMSRHFDLLMTGSLSPEVARIVAAGGVTDSVHALGVVAEARLPCLYRGAEALLMPSFYEGFGLPVVEAMACGTPVLSSGRTSLPEVGGDAVSYFDPNDPDSLIDALHRVGDTALMARLRQQGPLRARQFDWDRVGERLWARIGS